jgi:selenide,water dikinase
LQVLEAIQRQPLPNCKITLVVDRTEAMYSGMVPGLVAGDYTAPQLSFDLRAWAHATGADLVLGRAVGFDAQSKQIALADGTHLPYDLCSWNIGSAVAGLEIPGAREFALATRPIGDFCAQVMPKLQTAIAAASVHKVMRILVIGGGAAGVELGFCLQQRAFAEGAIAAQTTLLYSGEEVLPQASASLRRAVKRIAKRRQVQLLGGQRVIAVHQQEVETASAKRIPFDLCIWATGAAAHLEGGWIPVGADLQHVSAPGVFAVGDCAQLTFAPSTPKAGVYAVREGPILAHNLRAALAAVDAGSKLSEAQMQSYQPQSDFLTLLNLGDGFGVGGKWGITFTGKWVQRWKNRIDCKFSQRFQIT